MVSVAQLEYVRVGALDLKAWARFGVEVMGLQVGREDPDNIYFRMDDAAFRIHVRRSEVEDVLALGFGLPDRDALDSLSSRLSGLGAPVTPGTPEEVRARRVEAMSSCRDPNGINIELVCGLARESSPFNPVRPTDGFVTGDNGLGHVVLIVDELEPSQAFYCDGLGMRLTDHVVAGALGSIPFLHCNPRHHTVALVPLGPNSGKRLNHIQVQMRSMDDVGTSYDLAEAQGILTMSLGKHLNDEATSFYARTPSGFAVEIAWGGVQVDDAVWRPQTHHAASIWGHHDRAPS